MKTLLLFLLCPILLFSQTQIGADIDGEAEFDYSAGNDAALSMSSDGSIVAIGARWNDGNGPDSGHVRIYENVGGVWTQIGSDIYGEAPYDYSGFVSLSYDGTVVAIGAPGNDGNGSDSGHVRVYKNVSDVWTQVGSDINGEAADDFSGIVSLSSDGTVVAIGAAGNDGNGSYSGHVRVYKNISDVWIQVGSDIDGEAEFDSSGIISLSSDGNTVAIGAQANDGNGEVSGHVRIYKNVSDVWTQVGSDIDGEAAQDSSGGSVSISSDGSIVAIGASLNDGNGGTSGHVRVYKNVSDVWTQVGADIDGEAVDFLGASVSLSSDGSLVAIGAEESAGTGEAGYVRVYKNVSGVWTPLGTRIDGEAAEDESGKSVSISSNGSVVAIGARFNDGNGSNSGHVRVYDLSALLSTDSFTHDYFSMYPNPAKDVINLKLKQGVELSKVNIYNSLGQFISSTLKTKIKTSNLTSGIYFLEVETNQGKSTQKMIVD